MVYVCVLRGKKVIPFSLEKKDYIYLTGMPVWRQNWQAAITARSSHAKFIVMVVLLALAISIACREIRHCP